MIDQIQDADIVTEHADLQVEHAPVQDVVEETEKEYTIRTQATGDRVYLIRNGERIWVKNPETLSQLGFVLGHEKNVEYAELLKYKDGGSIDLSSGVPVEIKPDQPKTDSQKKEDDKINAILGVRTNV